jgi:hypothetical protein
MSEPSPILVSIPASWYLGAHGDPVARFDYLVLQLHSDGTVTWFRDVPSEETTL